MQKKERFPEMKQIQSSRDSKTQSVVDQKKKLVSTDQKVRVKQAQVVQDGREDRLHQ